MQRNAAELRIVDAASGWLAVNKPAGLSVHNAPRKDICALVRERIEADKVLRRTVALDASWGVHAVHRLDKDTSGILLLATQADAFTALSKRFANRMVAKRYLAVVHGSLARKPFDRTLGEWVWPLSVEAGGRRRPAGGGKRLPCRTRYRVEQNAERYTLISCEPVSGRKHQIRRHAKLSGHPVVGDRRYGSKRALTYLESTYVDTRLALHAWQLRFQPPDRSQLGGVTLSADPLPEFITRLVGGIDVEGLKATMW
ncbi:MAG: RNA pseudouridine synthase [Desulfosarcinaceae bacterium]|nr:RNA pseudouridine synthase [Desulfosarcinaceae bacterium]